MTGILAMMGGKNPFIIEPTPTVQVTNPAGTSVVLDRPVGVVSGDLLVSLVNGVGTASWSPGSGFSERFDGNGIELATKAAGGSEPSTYTFSPDNNQILAGTIIRVIGGAYATVGTASGASSTPAAPEITMTAPGKLLAIFFNSSNVHTFSPPTDMESLVASTSEAPFHVFVQAVAAGATGTRTSTCTGGNAANARGILLGLVPA